jgi:hypothetical protein
VDFTVGNKEMVQYDPEATSMKSTINILDEESVYPKSFVSALYLRGRSLQTNYFRWPC